MPKYFHFNPWLNQFEATEFFQAKTSCHIDCTHAKIVKILKIQKICI